MPICDFLRYWEIPLFCFHVKHLDTPDRQQLAAISALRIRQSSGLEQILQTAVQEVQQLLECDRVTIYQVVPNSDRNFTEDKFAKLQLNKLCEAGAGNFSHPITEFITFVAKNYQPCLQDLKLITKNKSQASIFTPQNRQKVPQTYILAPILLNESGDSFARLWGLLVASQNSNQRQWQSEEVDILNQLIEHLASTIYHTEILNQALANSENEKQLSALKSEFVATVSYEYRTFLASILAAVSTLLQHSNKLEPVKHQQFLQLIADKATQMAQLVDQLLVIEKFEFGKLAFRALPFELLQFFNDVIEEQRDQLSDRHQITFQIAGNTRGFWGDQKLLRLILVNLLSNAIKYSPDGGNIEVRLLGKDSEIIFDVQDRGIGIPGEEQEKLFMLFARGSNFGTIPGTGLGLAIVKTCVELHGGKVTLESQIHQGTKVTVSLPKRLLQSNLKFQTPKLQLKTNL